MAHVSPAHAAPGTGAPCSFSDPPTTLPAQSLCNACSLCWNACPHQAALLIPSFRLKAPPPVTLPLSSQSRSCLFSQSSSLPDGDFYSDVFIYHQLHRGGNVACLVRHCIPCAWHTAGAQAMFVELVNSSLSPGFSRFCNYHPRLKFSPSAPGFTLQSGPPSCRELGSGGSRARPT